MDSMWIQSCRVLSWLEDKEDSEVEFEVELVELLVPDVDMELTRLMLVDDDVESM